MIGRCVLALGVTALACGGEKKAAPESAAIPQAAEEAPATPAASPALTPVKTALPVKPSNATDSAAAKAKPGPSPLLHDSAFGPKFEVDARGNVKPIKRP